MQPFQEIGEYAKVDFHRGIRQGVPEVIYGSGKTKEHILGIAKAMRENGQKTVLITRLTQEAAAEQVGFSRPAVANALRLLSLPEPVLAMLEEGSLSAGHARALLALGEEELICRTAELVVKEELNVRQTEELIKKKKTAKQPKPSFSFSDEEINKFLACYDKVLTNKEKDIATAILKGKTRDEIAAKYFISKATVKTHINHIYTKLNVFSRNEFIDLVKDKIK